MNRRGRILLGLFVPYVGGIILSSVYPQVAIFKGAMLASAFVLAVVQIRWVNQDVAEEEARISRHAWESWSKKP